MVMTLPTGRAMQHKRRELESLSKEWRRSLSKGKRGRGSTLRGAGRLVPDVVRGG
jgi:hypothetical protein